MFRKNNVEWIKGTGRFEDEHTIAVDLNDPACSGVGIAHDLYRTMGNIDVCTKSELLEVKVPMDFLVAGCFFLAAQGRTLESSIRYRAI